MLSRYREANRVAPNVAFETSCDTLGKLLIQICSRADKTVRLILSGLVQEAMLSTEREASSKLLHWLRLRVVLLFLLRRTCYSLRARCSIPTHSKVENAGALGTDVDSPAHSRSASDRYRYRNIVSLSYNNGILLSSIGIREDTFRVFYFQTRLRYRNRNCSAPLFLSANYFISLRNRRSLIHMLTVLKRREAEELRKRKSADAL